MKIGLALIWLACVYSPIASASETAFSVNDLSIMIPLVSSEATSKPKYVVHPGDAQFPLLPVAEFNSVLQGAHGQQVYLDSGLTDPQNWYLVGIRYAPCTIFHGATPACQEQLRFVFQATPGTRGGFDDYAIHVVYNYADLSAPKLSARLDSFRKLKNLFPLLTLDQPLGPHPILNSSNGDAYFKAIKTEIIDKHVASRHPDKITFLGLGSADGQKSADSDHWIFLQGRVDGSGRWAPVPLPIGGPAISEQVQVDQDEMTLVSNVNSASDPFNLFAPKFNALKTGPIIFDQLQTNDHNVDCNSCHMMDNHVFITRGDDDQQTKDAFLGGVLNLMKDEPRVSEMLIDNSVRAGRATLEIASVRIFGYLDARPMISERVVADGALAARQANQLLNLAAKPQCVTVAQRTKLLTCLYLEGDEDATFAKCAAASCD